MKPRTSKNIDDAGASGCSCQGAEPGERKPDFSVFKEETASCCGSQPAESTSRDEMPGYRLWRFVQDFEETPIARVPRVRADLDATDRWGTVATRLGAGRNDYRIAPGLYCIGKPDDQSPVLVSANYKLSFDVLRSHLKGIDAWILVVDTNGINVWCAAGKGTFSTLEVAGRVNATSLEKIVAHRRLILPQLSATGVAARQVNTMCGFKVVWGPVHAKDIKVFLDNGMTSTPEMRKVTFSFTERMELVPVELNHMGKPTLYVLPVLFLLSGIGTSLFSFSDAVSRGVIAFWAYILALLAGAVVTPALLPWLPGAAFALKGIIPGAAAGVLLSIGFANQLALLEMVALSLFTVAVSSYLAMNFTGSTPFTSPTGVEKEMRRAIPVQLVGMVAAAILWASAGFVK